MAVSYEDKILELLEPFSSIDGVVFDSASGTWSFLVPTGKVMSWSEALPYLQVPFHSVGHFPLELMVWSGDKVVFTKVTEKANYLVWVPRNPSVIKDA